MIHLYLGHFGTVRAQLFRIPQNCLGLLFAEIRLKFSVLAPKFTKNGEIPKNAGVLRVSCPLESVGDSWDQVRGPAHTWIFGWGGGGAAHGGSRKLTEAHGRFGNRHGSARKCRHHSRKLYAASSRKLTEAHGSVGGSRRPWGDCP